MAKESIIELAQMPIEKQTYYFTFGLGHKLAGHCQPIIASSYRSARETMIELHGKKWAFQYTESEYLLNRIEGTANEICLKPIEGR